MRNEGALTAGQRRVAFQHILPPRRHKVPGTGAAVQSNGLSRSRIGYRLRPQIRRCRGLDMGRTKRIGVIQLDSDGVGDPIEVSEQRRLQDRVQDGGIIEPCCPGEDKKCTGERPRPLGHLNGEPCERSNSRVGMAVRHCPWIDHDRARQSGV